jgi:hypothetical protein
MNIPRKLFTTFERARFFNLNIVKNSKDFNKYLEQKAKKDYFTNDDVNEFIFPKDEMNRNDSKLYASFNGNYLSSIDVRGEFRNFKSGFEWKNIPNTFSIIIGINGKTGLLHLIEKIAEIHASQ